ncbi:MAG: glycerate kinase [Flaviramulus sp.]|nr:glycerate kinase [Flaviramulus sp.]
MKFILAPDKFKGSLTGLQFCKIVEQTIKMILPDSEILNLPLSDGGDGTIEILEYHLKGELINLEVNDPLFRTTKASYLYIDNIKTAFIEMAAASGLALLKAEEQNCYYTTTIGTGEVILDAIKRGVKTIILGIGGSATNDCGVGMAAALGYKFIDKNGFELSPIGKNLSKIHHIKTDNVIGNLNDIEFKVACDVKNPLHGLQGAAYIYGPQKGASKEEIALLDNGLKHISKLFSEQFNKDVQIIKGSGAAGGMGAGSIVFLNAELQSGIDLVKQLIEFDKKIYDSDWIITGEGKLDSQTLSGKTIKGVLASAKAKNIKVATFCGALDLDENSSENFGIHYTDAVINYSKNLDDAIKNSEKYVKEIAINFAKSLIK